MSFEELTRGSVILYPFLWSREQKAGETEGRKRRETVLVARFTFQGEDQIALLPITASEPPNNDAAYELPETEVRRIARGGKLRLWVILSEINFDIPGKSFHLEPDCKVGELSPRVFAAIWKAFADNLEHAQKIDRTRA